MRYVDANVYGAVMSLHPVTVRKLCREGKVAGAIKIGASWRIPLPEGADPPHGQVREVEVTEETITEGF